MSEGEDRHAQQRRKEAEVRVLAAVVDEGLDGVYRLDLLCSGFLPDGPPIVDALESEVANRGL